MSSAELIQFKSVGSNVALQRTTCPYCGVGCGVDVQIQNVESEEASEAEVLGLSGTPEHPANFGRLCVKGSRLLDTLEDSGRLLFPEVSGKQVPWEAATNEVAQRFQDIIDEHGPDSVALYVSGQLLTEDYYVANKLMKGYIGSANIDTNSRLCMSSAVAAHKRAFGSDVVPCSYEDLEQTELLVFIGSNAAWTHPVLFQRVERAKQINPNLKIVFIDPRRTASCEVADLHLPLKAGSDVALFNGLLAYLAEHDGLDKAYIDQSVEGVEQAVEAAQSFTIEKVAQLCDLPEQDVEEYYASFAQTDKVISFFSMGVNQSSAGVDKAASIINCHLASGKIGKEGCGPFSITGQPNAMGGREVGGLANLLAAHMDIDNAEHRALVQEYWSCPTIVESHGHKAVDLFQKIESGDVKAVWVMATNPVVSLPNRLQIESALKKCDFVVVSDYVSSNDTLPFADVKLPATSWSEKDGTVTNSERTISRQRAFLPPLGEAKHDWRIICDVAIAMGFDGFDFASQHEVFDEYAGLTAYKNNGSRDLDLSGLCDLSSQEYDQLAPVQWPINDENPKGTKRLFEDGKFFTLSQKANCIAVQFRPPEQAVSEDFPFVLNSGRLRDQWHTMTRTGMSAQLSQHTANAYIAIHPEDAKDLSLEQGAYVSVTSAVNSDADQVVLPVVIDDGLRRGELFVPIHWGTTWSSSSAIAKLYTDARDPISGQPELKHAAVALSPVEMAEYGELFSLDELPIQWLDAQFYVWSKAKVRGGMIYRFACKEKSTTLGSALNAIYQDVHERYSYQHQNGMNRFATRDQSLVYGVFTHSEAQEYERAWLESMLDSSILSEEQIQALLHAEVDSVYAQGRMVCSCYKVGEKEIIRAIQDDGCDSVEALGSQLKCGTNCGSCKSELKQILKQNLVPEGERITLEEFS
ncbi:MAG: nitrate reductase [Oleiphilaceae bacterium]|nr:nitrate reductase [Oleiphilaceae bacterium]